MRAAIFAATVWEFRAVQAAIPGGRLERCAGKPLYVAPVGSGECWVMQTGMGLEQAGASARALFQQRDFALGVSTGYACALTEASIGDVLLGTTVSMLERPDVPTMDQFESGGVSRERFCLAVREGMSGLRCVEGLFVSVAHVVGRASEKQALARRTGAIGLDMESAALACEARAAGVPFVIARTVSDLREEDLPLDFNLFLRPTGWLKGVAAVVMQPRCLLGIARLRRQSLVAARQLTRCLEDALGRVFAPPSDGRVPTVQ